MITQHCCLTWLYDEGLARVCQPCRPYIASFTGPTFSTIQSTEQATESRPGVMSGICTRHLKTTRRYLFSQHPANIFLTIKQLLQSHRFCVGQPHELAHPSLPGFCLLCHPLRAQCCHEDLYLPTVYKPEALKKRR